DADRIGTNLRVPAAMPDHAGVAIDLGAKDQLNGLEKIRTVRRRLEAGDIAAQQTFEHLSSPGTDTKHVERWPRDMPEHHDRAEWKAMAQLARREGKVIVLHEQERRRARGLVRNRSSEPDVGGRVAPEIARSKYRLHTQGRSERPQPFIREAVVIPAILRLGQADVTQPIAWRRAADVQFTESRVGRF